MAGVTTVFCCDMKYSGRTHKAPSRLLQSAPGDEGEDLPGKRDHDAAGKKYTRQQIMQLLCVYHLKQTLRLSDIKALTGRDDVDFEACYTRLLAEKERMRSTIPPLLREHIPANADDPNERLALCLALSEIACYLRRLCESLIDAIPEQTGGK